MNGPSLVPTLSSTAPSWSSCPSCPSGWGKKSLVREGGQVARLLAGWRRETSSEVRPHSYVLSVPIWLDAEPVTPQGSTGPELRGHEIEHPSSLSWGLA